jgi:hypothetical protein
MSASVETIPAIITEYVQDGVEEAPKASDWEGPARAREHKQ